MHFYFEDAGYMAMGGSSSNHGIKFRSTHAGTLYGYMYYDNAYNKGFLSSGGSWSFRVDNSGNCTATGNVTAYSDSRIKKDVHTIDNALDKVLALRGVNYTRIANDEYEMGLVAQEVKDIIPEVVSIIDETTAEDGGKGFTDLHVLKYQNMVGLLVEAIKEQQTQINSLKDTINSITGEN